MAENEQDVLKLKSMQFQRELVFAMCRYVKGTVGRKLRNMRRLRVPQRNIYAIYIAFV